jgi:hypothetical protein
MDFALGALSALFCFALGALIGYLLFGGDE